MLTNFRAIALGLAERNVVPAHEVMNLAYEDFLIWSIQVSWDTEKRIQALKSKRR